MSTVISAFMVRRTLFLIERTHMNTPIRFLLSAFAAVLILGDLPQLSAAPRHTGISGQTFLYVSYGPPIEIAPGIFVSPGNVQTPVATSLTIYNAKNHKKAAEAVSDADGHYRVTLKPGRYLVVPADIQWAGLPGRDCALSTAPFEVTVRARHFTPANVFYFSEGPPCSLLAVP